LGAGRFVKKKADNARGLPKPRVAPIWKKNVIPAPSKIVSPPRFEQKNLHYFTMDMSPDHIAKVKSSFFVATGQRCSAFDVCIAKTWQSRVRALRLDDPTAPVHVCFFANTRHLLPQYQMAGFYGNCFYTVKATRLSGEVAAADVVEVVRAVRDAKTRLTADFARWAAGGFERDMYELTFSYDSLFVSDCARHDHVRPGEGMVHIAHSLVRGLGFIWARPMA
ncbi:hypothetical protein BAE44_0023207, partial [Dichanthelium oligosanthes]